MNNLMEVTSFAKGKIQETGLTIEYSYNKKMTKTLGHAIYHRKTKKIVIEISENYAKIAPIESVKDTILHELAHAIDYSRRQASAHDSVWKAICLEIGAKPERLKSKAELGEYVQFKVKTAKYTLTCPCCGRVTPRSRRPKYSESCGTCDPEKYNEKYKLVLKQNY